MCQVILEAPGEQGKGACYIGIRLEIHTHSRQISKPQRHRAVHNVRQAPLCVQKTVNTKWAFQKIFSEQFSKPRGRQEQQRSRLTTTHV